MSRLHWLALSMIPGVGVVTARKLVERFGTVAAIFDAPAGELAGVPRVTPEIAHQIRTMPLESVEAELLSLDDEGIVVLTLGDGAYPALLRACADAPLVLFVRGEVRPEDARAVAIVGTRQPAEWVSQAAEDLARELAGRGWSIVSGLALGIDTAAHCGALAAEGGRSLAVLGSGLRVIHPRQNSALAARLAVRGALLSELPPDTPPRGPQLMARDRIVSGLVQVVVVIEAGEKSGSLDTAARARKQGRPVLAMAGSPGTDGLIAAGALRLDLNGESAALQVEAAAGPAGTSPGDQPAQQLSLW